MSSGFDDADWDRLIDDLRAGTCTPFLGAGACTPPLPTGTKLSTDLAAKHGYPFKDYDNLPKVAHYAATKAKDRVSIKRHVCQEIEHCSPPSFATPSQPHALLAELSLPLYLTTNYDDFMFLALRERQKRNPHSHQEPAPYYLPLVRQGVNG